MSKALTGIKIAILVANGYSERDMTDMQRALIEAGASAKIVSPENGLVNGWTGAGWGHHFAVEASLSTALGVDYDMVAIPGGQRSHDKLKMTAHTKRFVSSAMNSKKPVALFGDALNVMISSETVRGNGFAGPAKFEAEITAAGGSWCQDMPCVSGNVISGDVTDENRKEFIASVMDFFIAHATLAQDSNQAA